MGKADRGTVRVTQGEQVEITLSSDQPAELHLHGYDLSAQPEPGMPGTFSFVAKIAGRFPVEAHRMGPAGKGGAIPVRCSMSKFIRPRRAAAARVRHTLAMRLSSRPALEWASIPFAAIVCSVMPVATADAHGFGQRYDLPIPLGFYVVGAGATVALSFVLVAVFFTAERIPSLYPRLVLHVPARGWANWLRLAIRTACAVFFVFLIFAGIAGEQNPFRNIVVVSVWIIGWVGISLGSALLGDVWRLIDPWSTIFTGLERIYAYLGRGRLLGANRVYPKWLAAWPALALFVGFAWMELVWAAGAMCQRDWHRRCSHIRCLRGWGCSVFGREVWRTYGEVFSIAFGISLASGWLPCVRGRPPLRSGRPLWVSWNSGHWTRR